MHALTAAVAAAEAVCQQARPSSPLADFLAWNARANALNALHTAQADAFAADDPAGFAAHCDAEADAAAGHYYEIAHS